jgi:hypothetical protein
LLTSCSSWYYIHVAPYPSSDTLATYTKAKPAPPVEHAALVASAAAANRVVTGPPLDLGRLSVMAAYDAAVTALVAERNAAIAFSTDIAAEKLRISNLKDSIRVLKARCTSAAAAMCRVTDGPAAGGGAGGPDSED